LIQAAVFSKQVSSILNKHITMLLVRKKPSEIQQNKKYVEENVKR
jgi:hypothetical protein